MKWKPLDADVLEALRNGESLCPKCLGHKHVLATLFADFAGDPEYSLLIHCSQCGGTGLDRGKTAS